MEQNHLDGKEIANNIRAERNRAKLTQEYVAKELGITTKTYISYEANAQSIKDTPLYNLSLILKCNVTDFYLQK